MHWVHLGPEDVVLKKEEMSTQPEPAAIRVMQVTPEVYKTIDPGWKFHNMDQWQSPSGHRLSKEPDPLEVEINNLQEQLRSTYWIVVEILEYQYNKQEPPHDMKKVYEMRQQWRNEKAELERQLKEKKEL